MSAISYLLVKTVKNEIVDTFHKPLKLMLYLFIAVSMIYGAVLGYTSGSEGGGELLEQMITLSKGRALSGIYLAILYFISVPILLKGLSSGTSFFSLSDVNNMFVAPISSRRILIYGVGRQLASMLVLVVTFAAYGGMLINMFHISLDSTLILIIGIAVMLVLVQLVTLMIFCISSGHPERSGIMRFIIIAFTFLAPVLAVLKFFTGGITFDNLFTAVSLPYLEYIPFVGWMHGFVFGIINMNMTNLLVYGILLIITAAASILVLANSDLDFYEDVLSQAESYQDFREAVREGRFSDKIMMGARQVRLRKQGINRGKGASAVFFKHLCEGSRRSRFMFFNMNTVVLLFASFIIAIGMHIAMPDVEPTIVYLAISVILVYVQFFFSASGDWVKEMTKPYIYLIPDGAVKKLVMASATGLIKPFTDGFITYFLLSVYNHGHLCDIIVSALVYGSFGTLYIAANILAQRLVGIDSSGGIFITFYMSLIVLTLIPGVIAGLLVLANFAGVFGSIASTLLGLPILIWNMAISAVIFLMCRNLLDNTQ